MNKVEMKEVIIITNELGKEIFTKEGELIASMPNLKKAEGITFVPDVAPRNTLSCRIKEVMKNHNFKLTELAELTGIAQSALSMMKNRKLKMSRKNAIKMQESGLGDAKSWIDLKV